MRSWIIRFCASLLVALVTSLSTGPASAQDPDVVLSATDATGLLGQSVNVTVELDNSSQASLLGWSYGLCSDSSLLLVNAATSGTTTSTANGGMPPEFESIDVSAGGVTHAVVVCFTICAVLPPGLDAELLNVSYDIISAASTATTLDFCQTLGSPPVEVVFSDESGQAVIPTPVSGTVTLNPAPASISNLNCQPSAGLCDCELDFTWTNNDNYDTIELFANGLIVATFPGSNTSLTLTPAQTGLVQYCLVPTTSGTPGAPTCCTTSCATGGSVDPDPVEQLTCTTDSSVCEASVTWITGSVYQFITITVDGVLDQTLSGSTESATVALGAPGFYEICIGGTTLCGDPIPETCCTVQCSQPFLRGDCNGDGGFNLPDSTFLLISIFVIGAPQPTCMDACDSNDDGSANLVDAVYNLDYLFNTGPAVLPPFTACGFDPTESDPLGCDTTNCP